MSYRNEKTSNGTDLLIDGFDKGIATSPHKGMANIQNANISTETGEIMCSFGRIKQSQEMTSITGTLTQVNTNTVTATMGDGSSLKVGQVINITNAGTTGLKVAFTALSTVQVLVVGGGGGGAGNSNTASGGGGGGAGGYLVDNSHTVTATSYSVTVGAGGTGGVSGSSGSNGTSSIFDSLTATAGGGGGAQGNNGLNGASGGGGGSGVTSGGTGTAQGNAGGNSTSTSNGGAGGGGANTVGSSGASSLGGNGGAGKSNSISGSALNYAGGGGGGDNVTGGTGGAGGGGNGGNGGNPGSAGTANTGGGGGGGAPSNAGGNGGTGVVVISYPTPAVPQATGGTMTTSGGNTIHTFTTGGTFTVFPSQTGNYYYLSTGKLYGGTFTTGSLPPNNPDAASVVTGITSGTATFTLLYPLGQPFQSATEPYRDSTGTMQYRYYILDTLGSVWVHDTRQLANWDTPVWGFVGNAGVGASGIAILNGWLVVCPAGPSDTLWKLTVLLGNAFSNTGGVMGIGTSSIKYSTVAQSTLYIASGNNVTTIQPDVGLITSYGDIQSYGSYTTPVVANTGNVSLISGANPTVGIFADRVPAVFFTDGTLPSAINPSVIYYIQFSPNNPGLIQVFGASSGGSALDIRTGATGNQYYNTFDPTSTPGQTMLIYTFSALILPYYETITAIAQLGINLVAGTNSNIVYLWDKTNLAPSGTIFLAENGVANLLTVNNNVFIFAGNKGNIYITNGSAASPVISVPDYCAGIAGSPSTYIEPYFTWGASMYVRGRVYFSIQDQTSIKTGNCGGIWSFIPTQNMFIGDDTGVSLRLENQNSYGSYNGAASVLLPNQQQNAIGPQYWSGWYSSISSPAYGIDFTDTIPVTTTTFETDLIPTGTVLDKKTFTQIEYKLAAPLVAGESFGLSYRQNGVDVYATCGSANVESTTSLSGYFQVNFQKGQWIQFLGTMTSTHNSSSSFVRLVQLRIR